SPSSKRAHACPMPCPVPTRLACHPFPIHPSRHLASPLPCASPLAAIPPAAVVCTAVPIAAASQRAMAPAALRSIAQAHLPSTPSPPGDRALPRVSALPDLRSALAATLAWSSTGLPVRLGSSPEREWLCPGEQDRECNTQGAWGVSELKGKRSAGRRRRERVVVCVTGSLHAVGATLGLLHT
ncbi:unnamed protein product, partial [Closterium sp. NIES-64]